MAEPSKRGSTSKLSGAQKSLSASLINFTAGGNAAQTAKNFGARSPQADMRATKQSVQLAAKNFCHTGGLSRGGTFSRADGPKILPENPYGPGVTSKSGLF